MRSQKRPAKKRRASVKVPRRAAKIPAAQGNEPKRGDVGYCRPPVEHQFVPGESGNPAGAPRARTNLWPLICHWLTRPESEVRAASRDRRLAVNQRTAAKQAMQLLAKGLTGVGLGATIHMWDRDEGKATQRIDMTSPDLLTPEECEEIRKAMRR